MNYPFKWIPDSSPLRIVRIKRDLALSRQTEPVLDCFSTVVPIHYTSIVNVESEGWGHAGLNECDWIKSKKRSKE